MYSVMKLSGIIFLLFFGAFAMQAQVDSVYYGKQHPTQKERPKEKSSPIWKEKIIWGGNVQAWIGNPTFLLLSPTIGYTPVKNLYAGLGFVYNYISYNSYYGSYSQSIWGGHSFARYVIGDSYFVQVQYDKLLQPNLLSAEPNAKTWVDYVLVGGGFQQPVGDRVALSTSVMYNLSQSPLSIYPSRVIIQFGIVGMFK